MKKRAKYLRMSPQDRATAYINLERYFVWAEMMHRAADDFRPVEDEASSGRLNKLRHRTGQLFLRFHWIAALVPVVEGWEALQLKDPTVEQLLYDSQSTHRTKSPHLKRLVLFRHSVYHYQESFLEIKQLGLLEPGFLHWCESLLVS